MEYCIRYMVYCGLYRYIPLIILKLLRQSTVSALIGFISEAVVDQVETSAMK